MPCYPFSDFDFLCFLDPFSLPLALPLSPPVVHCVQVPLTGTTVAEFWGVWEFGWDWFMYSYLLLCTILWTIGGPSIIVCNGPTSWQCSQAYMFDPVSVHVIFHLGIAPSLVSAQSTGWCRTVWWGHNKWFQSPETGATLWAAFLEKTQPVADERWPPHARSAMQWDEGPV